MSNIDKEKSQFLANTKGISGIVDDIENGNLKERDPIHRRVTEIVKEWNPRMGSGSISEEDLAMTRIFAIPLWEAEGNYSGIMRQAESLRETAPDEALKMKREAIGHLQKGTATTMSYLVSGKLSLAQKLGYKTPKDVDIEGAKQYLINTLLESRNPQS